MTERGLPSADASPACPFVAFEDDRDGARRPARPPPPLLRRGRAGAARAGPPGGVLPVERVPGLPGVPEVGPARGGPGASAEPQPPPRPRTGDRRPDGPRRGVDRRPRRLDGHDARAACRIRPSSATRRATGPRRRRGRAVPGPPRRAPPAAARRPGHAAGRRRVAPDFLTTPSRARARAWPAAPPTAWPAAARVADGRSTRAGPGARRARRPAPPPPRLRAAHARRALDAQRTAERDADLATYARSVDRAGEARQAAVASAPPGPRQRDAAAQRERVQAHDGAVVGARPSATRPIRRSAAAASLPGIPRVAVLAGALALVGARAVLPAGAVRHRRGRRGASTRPRRPARSSRRPRRSRPRSPEPTPQTYVIQEGDTLSKIAQEIGLTPRGAARREQGDDRGPGPDRGR